MKKHRNRKALWAVDVFRWIKKNILSVKLIPATPIFYLVEAKSVRQNWLVKRRQNTIKKSAMTYLKKGLLLVPVWQVVPDWEISFFQQQGIDLISKGIVQIGDRWLRLAFMQDEDLNHALRQQDYVLNQYLEDQPILADTFEKILAVIDKEKRIISKIGQRKIGIQKLQTAIKIKIASFHRSIQSIIDNSPLFKQEGAVKDLHTVIAVLRKISRECYLTPVRPVGIRLRRAGRSIDCAILNLKKRQFYSAKLCLKSALKNLSYPEET